MLKNENFGQIIWDKIEVPRKKHGGPKHMCLCKFVVKDESNIWILAFSHWIWPLRFFSKIPKCDIFIKNIKKLHIHCHPKKGTWQRGT